MNSLLAAGVILVHSFYPLICCSDRDCHKVDDAVEVKDGYTAEGIFYPKELVKPSMDGNFHACRNPVTMKPLCFFVPTTV